MNSRLKPPATTLHDFADLKKALRKAAREAAARAEAEQAAQALREAAERQRQAERALFAHAVGPVHRLPERAHRAEHQTNRPSPVPLQRHEDEQSVLRESISDDFDVDSLMETDDTLSFGRPELGPDVLRKLRRGVWALQGEIDLHGLRTDGARQSLSQFLRDAQVRGWRCVRVVHGKGLGSPGRVPVLKDKVRRWLVQSDRVLAFVQARGDDGGAGALIVLLQSTGGAHAPPQAQEA